MGKIIAVGTGIKSISHLTEETRVVIKSADHCLYLVTEEHLKTWIEKESKSSQSLESFFFDSEKRVEIYKNISAFIVDEAKKYESLCVIFYGHPTFYAKSALAAVNEHKKQGYEAIVLPSVSSVDCLWSDLCVDPGDGGCSIFEATDFLVSKRVFDTRSHLILLQVGVIGGDDLNIKDNLNILQTYLEYYYPQNHPAYIYEASSLPGVEPYIDRVQIDNLGGATVSKISTLYVPPAEKAHQDPEMIQKIINNAH